MASNTETSLNNTAGHSVVGKLEADTPSVTSSQTSLEQVGVAKNGATWATSGLKNSHYRPVDEYEGAHRYDPAFNWSQEEEKKVVRKV